MSVSLVLVSMQPMFGLVAFHKIFPLVFWMTFINGLLNLGTGSTKQKNSLLTIEFGLVEQKESELSQLPML